MQRKDCEKRTRRGWLTAGLAVLLLAASAGGAEVRLWREAVVADAQVTVGDLCQLRDLSGEQRTRWGALVVAPAPVEGGSIIVGLDDVRRCLREAGVNLGTVMLKGAASCDVTRPKDRRPAADRPASTSSTATLNEGASADAAAPVTLRDRVEQFLNAELGQEDGTLRLQFGRSSDAALDLAEPEFLFDIERTSGSRLGMISLSVTVLANGAAVQQIPLLVNVSFVKTVVVAAHPLNVGAIVDAVDVRLVEMTFERFEHVGLSEPAAAIGQRVKRFVAPGTVVMPHDLEPVPLVKRGQIVDVHSRIGGVTIVTAGKVLEDGAYGDVVQLSMGERSRERSTATVTGPGHVTVRGEQAVALGGEQ